MKGGEQIWNQKPAKKRNLKKKRKKNGSQEKRRLQLTFLSLILLRVNAHPTMHVLSVVELRWKLFTRCGSHTDNSILLSVYGQNTLPCCAVCVCVRCCVCVCKRVSSQTLRYINSNLVRAKGARESVYFSMRVSEWIYACACVRLFKKKLAYWSDWWTEYSCLIVSERERKYLSLFFRMRERMTILTFRISCGHSYWNSQQKWPEKEKNKHTHVYTLFQNTLWHTHVENCMHADTVTENK